MNASRIQTLILVLAAGMTGVAHAGAGDITKRDQGTGSVELSNLGNDEDAQVVVAAPARTATDQAARTTVVPAARTVTAPEVAAADRQAKAAGEAKAKKDKDEEEAKDETGAERRGEYANAAERDVYASYGGGFGSSGYNYGGQNGGGITDGGTGTGSGSSNGSTGNSSGSTGNTSGSSGIGTGSTGSTAGAGSAPTAGLSPEQLAMRIAQYRDAMLNEQRGANGLVANPAVQRRYLMMNRAGYMGLGY